MKCVARSFTREYCTPAKLRHCNAPPSSGPSGHQPYLLGDAACTERVNAADHHQISSLALHHPLLLLFVQNNAAIPILDHFLHDLAPLMHENDTLCGSECDGDLAHFSQVETDPCDMDTLA